MNDIGREFDILNGRASRAAPNKRNIVEFYSEPYQDMTASAEQGRPIYRDVVLIRIMLPGDMRSIIERRAHEEDKITYAREWEAFQRQESLSAEGTALEHWPVLSRSMVRQLKAYSIFTVENLRDLTDGQVAEIGMLGLRTLRNQAAAFIEHAKTGAVSASLVSEKERLEARVAQLEQALADANLRFETLERSRGGDVSSMSPISVPQSESKPSATRAPELPATTKSMSTKEVLDLAERVIGIKFQTRKEAEEAIAEARTVKD